MIVWQCTIILQDGSRIGAIVDTDSIDDARRLAALDAIQDGHIVLWVSASPIN